MPKKPILPISRLQKELFTLLERRGPISAKEICESVGISQPTFSRLIFATSQAEGSILRMGAGKQTRYALKKAGIWGRPEIPIYSVSEQGTIGQVATLHHLSPHGFFLESKSVNLTSRFFSGFPYLFEDLRPSGFLGRLIPRLHPDLGLPEDIQAWTDEHCLLYLIRQGWDLIGDYILGETAYDLYVKNLVERLDVLSETDRATRYPILADLVLSTGIPGSSAAGEQPKFLSVRSHENTITPVLVKFSPPLGDALSRRVADLLICEQIAHEVLREYGHAAARSCLIEAGNRLFLEIERFDRTPQRGRQGVISLSALDLEFVGQLKSWSESAEVLLQQKKIGPTDYEGVVWLESFGKLIGNSDRHHGNISFYCRGETITGLAPAYDMLPMMYAPQQNQLVPRVFDPAPPKSIELPVWKQSLTASMDFWERVQRHPMISEDFKRITSSNQQKLSRLLELF